MACGIKGTISQDNQGRKQPPRKESLTGVLVGTSTASHQSMWGWGIAVAIQTLVSVTKRWLPLPNPGEP